VLSHALHVWTSLVVDGKRGHLRETACGFSGVSGQLCGVSSGVSRQ
jgi:hypothetical protein